MSDTIHSRHLHRTAIMPAGLPGRRSSWCGNSAAEKNPVWRFVPISFWIRSQRAMAVLLVIACAISGNRLAAAARDGDAASPARQTLGQIFQDILPDSNFPRSGHLKILSWGRSVVMHPSGLPGHFWQVCLDDVPFRITIQDQTGCDITDLIERLERIPPAYRAGLRIVSEPGKPGLTIVKHLGKNITGAATQNYISILPGSGTGVILHEIGHALTQRYFQEHPDLGERWLMAIRQDNVTVTRYGNNSKQEDQAEFGKIYAACLVAGPDSLKLLRQKSPMRFTIWEDILREAPLIPDPRLKSANG